MKKEEIKEIVMVAMEEVMDRKFVAYGFRIRDPNELQADMLYLRNLRQGSEAVRRYALRAFVGATIPTIIYMLWAWVKSHFTETTI